MDMLTWNQTFTTLMNKIRKKKILTLEEIDKCWLLINDAEVFFTVFCLLIVVNGIFFIYKGLK